MNRKYILPSLGIIGILSIHVIRLQIVSSQTIPTALAQNTLVQSIMAPPTNTPPPTFTPAPTFTPIPTETPTPVPPTPTPHVVNSPFWNTLQKYRKNQGKPALSRASSLCSYAQSRAQELSNNNDTSLSHATFQQDIDSGKLREMTGFSGFGENLAYSTDPNVSPATIIEDIWHNSPDHRDIQLSTEMTHGCIARQGIYFVGIYAK